MRKLWQFLTDSRVLAIAASIAILAFLFLSAQALELAFWWVAVAVLALLVVASSIWLTRWWWRKRQSRALADSVAPEREDNAAALRKVMLEAVGTIKTSKLGLARGAAALYELPWYMVIGNPAAGKSSAITASGLQFPIAGTQAVHGVGGTRNCDWFFTSEGILVDTAGRYAVEDGDRSEWLRFLDLLKRYRRRAPINGVIIAASLADLAAGPPQRNLDLARQLRTRMQELTERLGVHAPVYVLFTKADLLEGFSEFFSHADPAERERPWGATIRFNRRRTHQDILSFFDAEFTGLCDGLEEMSSATLAGNAHAGAGVFAFPYAFAALRTTLRAFLATLFEENAYQFRPVFRGFYFSSALQEGAVGNAASQAVADRFALRAPQTPAETASCGSHFLLGLFRQVVFADRELVARYTSPTRLRLRIAAWVLAALGLGTALAGWTASYLNNRQLLADVSADLDRAARAQDKRTDLQSRLEALAILQGRIAQLSAQAKDSPLQLGLGLYQGEALEHSLRQQYFAGMLDVLLVPAASALELRLADPALPAKEAYDTLKAYLMLSEPGHAEASHLEEHLARAWRGWLEANRGAMPRDQLVRQGESLLAFYSAQSRDPLWPSWQAKAALVDASRGQLRKAMSASSARDRVYADIIARANARFGALTLAKLAGEGAATLAGSRPVPGAFTREAWNGVVRDAIHDASQKSLRSTDWVLKSTSGDDLTQEGTPAQVEQGLLAQYKADYVRHWQGMLQSTTVAGMDDLESCARGMERLGPALDRMLRETRRQVIWDDPQAEEGANAQLERGFRAWFREVILRQAPSEVRTVAEAMPHAPASVVAREFQGVIRLLAQREKEGPLLQSYLDQLARLRSRLNQLRSQGDAGPGARQLLQQTLDGNGSELADTLRNVDEQVLAGLPEGQKEALRPILVRPLMQVFAALLKPGEAEINRQWSAQVVGPFRSGLAEKYPFNPASRMEASSAEIGQLFGPEGAVARFVANGLGTLVVRRGDTLSPRTWAGMGVSIDPAVAAAFPGWIAPLSANGVAASPAQTVFQLQPLIAPGIQEYAIDIDGQVLRYKNATPTWTNMVHPGPGVPGARITALGADGRQQELFNEAGQFGLKRMIDAANRQRRPDGSFELRWGGAPMSVSVLLKIVSNAETSGATRSGFHGMRMPESFIGNAAEGGAPPQAVGAAQ